MRLHQGEIIVRQIKRHPTPFVLRMVKIALVALPFYILIFYIGQAFSAEWALGLFAAVSFFIGVILMLICFDYIFDRLIITNKRVVWIDWRSPVKREEHEAELLDIQDIETREKGILSKLRMFDYGFLEIETASSKTCIHFFDCPDPESTKHFILGNIEKARGGIREKREPKNPDEDWSVN